MCVDRACTAFKQYEEKEANAEGGETVSEFEQEIANCHKRFEKDEAKDVCTNGVLETYNTKKKACDEATALATAAEDAEGEEGAAPSGGGGGGTNHPNEQPSPEEPNESAEAPQGKMISAPALSGENQAHKVDITLPGYLTTGRDLPDAAATTAIKEEVREQRPY